MTLAVGFLTSFLGFFVGEMGVYQVHCNSSNGDHGMVPDTTVSENRSEHSMVMT